MRLIDFRAERALERGGRIGRHRLLAVGRVTGADGSSGKEHETGTDSGLTAIVIGSVHLRPWPE